MVKRKLRKLKRAKSVVTDVVSEKAAELNPLTPREPEPLVPESVPKITDETIAEHREDVLSGARKYIYPLAHSKHRIIVLTTTILTVTIVAFLCYCTLAMYKLYQYNAFLYRVTQVVPFPIAREGGHFIDYENYLFELRHYVHYYQSKLQRNFAGADRQQLIQYRKQALDNTLNVAYTRDLAHANDVTISDREVEARIAEVRNQNRLGNDNKVFADVLRDYWGWSVNDFKRSLKQQILAEKVAAKLDTKASQRAQRVIDQLAAGANFSKLAQKYSQDERSAKNGGNYSFSISKSNPNVPPQVVDALFSLKPKKTSGIIVASPVLANSSPTLEIVRVLTNNGTTVTAQHITLQLTDISVYIKQLKTKQPPHLYVHL